MDLDNDDAPEEDPVEETMETDAEPEPTETTKKPMKLTYEKEVQEDELPAYRLY